MFHGGTNFGLTSGANDKGTYRPSPPATTTTRRSTRPATRPPSTGRSVRCIARHAPVPRRRAGSPAAPAPAFAVPLSPGAAVVGRAGPARRAGTRDAAGHRRRARPVPGPHAVPGRPSTRPGRRRARRSARSGTGPRYSWTGSGVGVLARDHHDTSLALPSGARGTLEMLVEDQGRVDYGPRIGEAKGLIGPVCLNGDAAAGLAGAAAAARRPGARQAALPPGTLPPRPPLAWPGRPSRAVVRPAESPADLFLSTAGLGKGIAWVNGFCLGRYWSRGPAADAVRAGPGYQERWERADHPRTGGGSGRHGGIRIRA